AAPGLQLDGQDLQGPPRRLQSAAVPDRPAAKISAQGVLLHQRRRPARGDPLRELEGGVLRTEDTWHARSLGRALHVPAPAETLQPAHRSVRARRYHLEHLLRLDDAARLPVRPGASLRAAVRRDVPGIPTATEAVELQCRPGHAATDASARRLTPPASSRI